MKNFIQDFGYNLGRYMMFAFVIAFIVAVFYGLISSANECEDRGGEYVRGIFWFKCVGGE